MADADVGTVEWYRDTLLKELHDQKDSIALYDNYYEGHHKMAFATTKFKRAFGDLFSAFADNWCDLVVDAVEERLNVEGFRFGDPVIGDTAAWDIWQRNQLDALSQQAHLESLINGMSSVIVWPGANGKAEITVEDPTQVVVGYDPGNPTKRRAALKAWTDDYGDTRVNLYLPNAIYKWVSADGQTTGLAGGSLEPLPGDEMVENPYGVVPVIPLVNRPRLLHPSASEIKKVLPMQDAVNKLISDMMVASEYQAYRQRWATGLELPTIYDEDGEPVPQDKQITDLWQHAIDRLWYTEDTETKFGEFSSTNLVPFTTAIEMLVQHIASQTRTPPHYFYLSGQFPSGESIKSAETGLVAKVMRKQRFFGESWEEVMRFAFAIEGDRDKANDFKAEVIWGDPESRTESEHVDAVSKKMALGVPVQQLWEDLGYGPTQIARFRAMRQQDVLDQSGLALQLANALDGAGRAAPVLPEGEDE